MRTPKGQAPRQARPSRLGLEVRARRKEARLSQEELAQRLGCTRVAVSEIERGLIHRPNNNILARLETTLGLSRMRSYELIGDVPPTERQDPLARLYRAAAQQDREQRIAAWHALPLELKDAVGTLLKDLLSA